MSKGRSVAVALGALAAVAVAAPARADELAAKWKGAPEFSADDMIFKVRGRILIDAVWEHVDHEPAFADENFDAFNLRGRQVFLGVEGQLNSMFAYKIEGGWVNGQVPRWDDAVLEYKPNDMTSIIVGNQKNVSLEGLTSTRFITFMDRGPYNEVLDIDYLLGVSIKANGANWSATLGMTGDSINAPDVTAPSVGKSNANEAMAMVMRGSWAPVLDDVDKVHLGLWFRYRDSASEVFTYQGRPNTNYGNRFISTGPYGDKDVTVGLEGAWLHGPFSVQAEYAWVDVNGVNTPVLVTRDADLQTGYVFLSWFPTGEQRPYDPRRGEFGRLKVLNPVTAGGPGAVELAVRFDYVDLTDARLGLPPGPGTLIPTAGRYKAITGGINYYPFSYVRVMANYTSSKNENPAPEADVDVNVFQTRFQLDF
jgi:phosphate-selective porin OprO/OprP